MKSDDPEAIRFIETTLNGLQAGWTAGALDTMGIISPKAYHPLLASHLPSRDEAVRLAAAGALERMAEPKAYPALLKQYKLEKADPVRARLLRAMASCGPAQKETLTQIDKVMAKESSGELRAQAVLALAQVDDKAKVHEGLRAALRDPSPKVRSTAAFVLASRRDAEFALTLEEAAAREEELDVKAWLEAAAKVVRGGDGSAFKNFLQRELGEVVPRAGLGGLGGRGGGNAGGGRGGGD
jgi:HEAT repeat protein